MAVGLDPQVQAADDLPLGRSLVEGGRQGLPQAFPGHVQDVVDAGLARPQFQIQAAVAMDVEDIALAVDEGAGRRELIQQPLLGQVAERLAVRRDRFARGPQARPRHVRKGPPQVRAGCAGSILPALVDFRFPVHHLEEVAEVAHGLRGALEEETAGVQGVVEQRNDLLLQVPAQVDQEVAAADQVQPGERRVLDEVLFRKDQHVPDDLLDAVGAAAGFHREKAREPFRGDVGCDAGRVDAGPGGGDRVGVDVRGEHLHLEGLLQGLHALLQEYGHRIGLFARGTARGPDAYRGTRGPALQKLGDDQVFEGLEGLRIAEETRDADQQIVEEGIHFPGGLLQECNIALYRLDLVDGEPALDAAENGVWLVL